MENSKRQLDYLHAEAASAWVQVLQDPTPEQRAAFVRWLKESPRNVHDIMCMFAVDQLLEHLDTGRAHDIQTILGQVQAGVVPLGLTPRSAASAAPATHPAPPRRRFYVALGLAAGLVLACVLGWVLVTHRASAWREYSTAMGEQRAFELEDGSIIHLNTHSRVALQFTGQAREVRLLQGEALFRVHHDTARPFRVYTPDAVIQAVGTQFNVYNRPDGTQVAVIEGRVNVTAEPHPTLTAYDRPAVAPPNSHAPPAGSPVIAAAVRSVGASEEARVDHAGTLSVHAVADVSEAVAWRERRLVFRNETLEHITDEFNRYGRTQIHLEDDAVAGLPFSGVFDADDPDSLAQVLARDASLSVRVSDQAIFIKKR